MNITFADNLVITAPASTITEITTDPIPLGVNDRLAAILTLVSIVGGVPTSLSYKTQVSHDGQAWVDQGPSGAASAPGSALDTDLVLGGFARVVFQLSAGAGSVAFAALDLVARLDRVSLSSVGCDSCKSGCVGCKGSGLPSPRYAPPQSTASELVMMLDPTSGVAPLPVFDAPAASPSPPVESARVQPVGAGGEIASMSRRPAGDYFGFFPPSAHPIPPAGVDLIHPQETYGDDLATRAAMMAFVAAMETKPTLEIGIGSPGVSGGHPLDDATAGASTTFDGTSGVRTMGPGAAKAAGATMARGIEPPHVVWPDSLP